jgi:DNA (cytosine-5)-methyltransferase 1
MGFPTGFTIAGLFAGIGGIERGLANAGGSAELLCELWEPARAVLASQFPDIEVAPDVRELKSLPKVDVVTAGFPCTDLSQAGRTKGIQGEQSGLVAKIFPLLGKSKPPVLVLENVRNMLVLDGGGAMRYLVTELEALGYRWAYRLVDSRFTGVPQRRQRVILVAARDLDPRTVLFAEDEGEPPDDQFRDDCFGFYWTEGLRGLGWAKDAVPTLKGGSGLGIPSPPAVWWRTRDVGPRVVVPSVEAAEELQGFPRGWTSPANATTKQKGARWKLVGNAVTVGVSTWLGNRLRHPGELVCATKPHEQGARWPLSAYGERGKVWTVDASMWPTRWPYRHLGDLIDPSDTQPLSYRGAAGFLSRARRAKLRFRDDFLDNIEDHVMLMRKEEPVGA